MTWGAVGSAAVGVLGGALAGNQASGSPKPVNPNAGVPIEMQPYWNDLLAQQPNLQAPEYYQGNTIAGLNDNLANSWAGMGSWGTTGAGAGVENALYNTGNMNLNRQGDLLGRNADFLGNLASGGGFTGFTGGGGAVSGQVSPYEYDQAAFDASFGNLEPGIAGAQDAATTDIYRQLGEQALPGINAGAAGSGGGFGSRAFNTGAIATRGALDRAADINAQYDMNARNQANQAGYGAGINTQNANTSITNANTAAAASRANAATSANASMNNALINAYGRLGDQGLQAGRLGLDQMTAGSEIDRLGLGLQNQAGIDQLGYNQDVLQGDINRWNYDQNLPWVEQNMRLDLLPGGRGVTPSGSPQQATGQNAFSGALGGLESALGIYGMGQDQGWWGGGGGGGNSSMDGWSGDSYGYW